MSTENIWLIKQQIKNKVEMKLQRNSIYIQKKRNAEIIIKEKSDKSIKDNKRGTHTQKNTNAEVGKNKTGIQMEIIKSIEVKPEESVALVEQKCKALENIRSKRFSQGWNISKMKGGTCYVA